VTDQPKGLRERILKDTFSHIDQSDGVVLVGILFDYRLVLSKRISSMVQQYSKTFDLDPLEPQSAAELVGELYGLDADELFLAFHNDWAAIRNSQTVKRLVVDIQSHRCVERIEPCDATL
jgi:hypothetical protein